jgi:hypothetical protein
MARSDAPALPPLELPRAPVAPASGATVSSGVDHFKLALYYHRSGDFENALIHYRAVLAQNELDAEARNNLGLLYQEKGLLDDVRGFAVPSASMMREGTTAWVSRCCSGKADAAAAEFTLTLDSKDVIAGQPRSRRKSPGADESSASFAALGLVPTCRRALQLALPSASGGDATGALDITRSPSPPSSTPLAADRAHVDLPAGRSRWALLLIRLFQDTVACGDPSFDLGSRRVPYRSGLPPTRGAVSPTWLTTGPQLAARWGLIPSLGLYCR